MANIVNPETLFEQNWIALLHAKYVSPFGTAVLEKNIFKAFTYIKF